MSDDAQPPEWKEGWPRGTWLKTSDNRLYESPGYLAQDSEGSKGYLMPLNNVDHRYRLEFVYLVAIEEVRTADGFVYRRRV